MFDAGGFIGVERVLTDKLLTQVGLSAYGDSRFSPKGDVWQFGLPKFDNFAYFYHISHARVMFSNKLLTTYSRNSSLSRNYLTKNNSNSAI